MSNYIYITRHGQSQWNVEKKVQGVTDTPLTQQGIEQSHALALKLKEEKIHVDEILYSPLSRAADTARIIAEENKLPLTMEPRLIEQNFGEYEGHEWTKHPGVFHEVKKQFACDYNGGESMLRLGQRIYNLIDELKERSLKENKTFLLVSHGGVVRMFHSYFFSESNEDFVSTSIENCEIRKYVFK
ncbi:MAG: histidine phosphatase family protein [Treponema sp.]|nr:histidine phosphatase family protein [Treponema sp.]